MEETGFEFACGVWSQIRPRLGERRAVAVSVFWLPTKPLGRRWGRRAQKLTAAVMEDVSISGARLLMAPGTVLASRSLIDIQVDGAWATARIAWAQDRDYPPRVECGVMFRDPEAGFMQAITRAMNGGIFPEQPASWTPRR